MRACSFVHDRAGGPRFSRDRKPNSSFHSFEVGEWVTTITNSGWLLFEKLRIFGTEEFKMVCVALQELTVTCRLMSAVITGKKLDRYNKYQTKQCTHTLINCTHNIWWLVLGWVTTKEDHPRLRIAYTSYIWRVIKFYLLTYLDLKHVDDLKCTQTSIRCSQISPLFWISARRCVERCRKLHYWNPCPENIGVDTGIMFIG